MRITLAVLGTAVLGTSLRANSDEVIRLDQEFKLRLQPDPVRMVETALQRPVGPVVREVKVQYDGPVTTAMENTVANMEMRVGQPYNMKAWEHDILSLKAFRNVTDVRIFGEPVTDGVRLNVVIKTKPATVP